MGTSNQYQKEQEDFRRTFAFLQEKPIAIYGIGRRTATLLPAIRDFCVVALLDRAPENIGRKIDGIPIQSLSVVNQAAEAIIINSDPGNFRVIYERIADKAEIPVYFANGERAVRREAAYAEHPYWQKSLQDLQDAIDAHEVISFDFFDTLVTRKTMTPTNLFAVLGARVQETYRFPFDFGTLRQQIAASCPPFANLDQIYEELARQTGITMELARAIEQMELTVEEQIDVLREPVAAQFHRAVRQGKQVVILSDTYYSYDQFHHLLVTHGLDDLPANQVYISSQMHKSKLGGDIYEALKDRYPQTAILHIGDHPKNDITQAKAHGFDTFYVMNPADMLKASSIGSLAVEASGWKDDVRLGLLAAKLFQDPFALHETQGKVPFHTAKTFGYAVYGGILLRFCEWLIARAREQHLRTLLFFARDGYLLEPDFCKVLALRQSPIDIQTAVVPISRQLIYLATMHTQEDFRRVASFAFLGTFRDYLFQRFNIRIGEGEAHASDIIHAGQDDTLLSWLQPYEARIWKEQARQERNYRKLLAQSLGIIVEPAGIVDFGVYGTTQHYFQQLLGKKFHGFYFLADLTNRNVYHQTNRMEACFQAAKELEDASNLVRKHGNFLESFLTAPYGMIRYVDDDGTVVTEPDRENQHHFDVKERVNDGIRAYMEDAIALIPMEECSGAGGIEAAAYYLLLDGSSQVSPEILQGFYFDNDMVGSKEVPLEV